ncbi:MAG: discoidin domain-containing protein, partial [Bacteroidales bacterium]
VSVPFNKETLRDVAEYFVNVQFVLDENKRWAPKEYVQAEEQILVKEATALPAVNKLAQTGKKLRVSDSAPKQKSVKGENFEVKFDMNTGSIYSLVYGDETIIEAGNGPKLDAFRAFVNNDNWFYQQWFEIGLHNLKHQATSSKVTRKPNGEVVVAFSIESQAPNAAKILGGTSSGKNSIEELTDQPFSKNDFKFITNQTWTVYPDGSVELQAAIASEFPNKVLPRLGYVMKVPQQYADFAYYGRGPIENYADRKSGQFVRVYESTVADQFTAFPKPQEVGNHEDVRWCALTNTQGKGAAFVATDRLSVSALQYSALDMTLAGHPHQLPEAGDTYLRLDMGVTGLGGNSCGQGGPLVEDRVMAGYNNLGFIIRPVATKNELEAVANVKGAGERPAPVMLSQEGKNRLKVISASSQEVGDGNASHLTDGDRGTIWHTMYSVTVAKYPHWVDLDAGEEKTVKGFTYLPRQEGGNGDIRDYAIYVSQDGKNWGEAIHQAAFENNKKEKRVMFTQPVKARYIRFTALNAQNGDDFASGAELNIVTD